MTLQQQINREKTRIRELRAKRHELEMQRDRAITERARAGGGWVSRFYTGMATWHLPARKVLVTAKLERAQVRLTELLIEQDRRYRRERGL